MKTLGLKQITEKVTKFLVSLVDNKKNLEILYFSLLGVSTLTLFLGFQWSVYMIWWLLGFGWSMFFFRKNINLLEHFFLGGIVSVSYTHLFINRINPSAIRDVQYVKWMENIEGEYLNKESMLQEYSKLESRPKFSIIFPVWNTEREILKKALDSVTEQVYENWEICISDGSSEKREETQKFLKSFQKEYPEKVKLCFLPDILRKGINIVANSNNAINISTGQYIIFMDCDDKLSPNCLLELAKSVEENPDVEFLYSDFDKIDENGRRFAPSFWPDFSPHLLTSQMYTVHVTCYRKDILNQLNGLRDGTDGAQDWDLALRYMILRKCKDFKNVLHLSLIHIL